MDWYEHLYLDKKCMRHTKRLKYKIEQGLPHSEVFLINLPQRSEAVLELIPSVLLMQKAYPREHLKIVGMGSDRTSALELMRQLIDEVYHETGGFDVAAYLYPDKSKYAERDADVCQS